MNNTDIEFLSTTKRIEKAIEIGVKNLKIEEEKAALLIINSLCALMVQLKEEQKQNFEKGCILACAAMLTTKLTYTYVKDTDKTEAIETMIMAINTASDEILKLIMETIK